MPDVVVTGSTSQMSATAWVGTPVLGPGTITLLGATAVVDVDAGVGAPIVGTVQPGDYYLAPTDLTGTSGSQSVNFSLYTHSSEAPSGTADVWFRYVSGTGNFTFTIPSGTSVYVVSGSALPEAGDVIAGPSTTTVIVTGTTTITYAQTGSPTNPAVFTWSFVSTDPEPVSLQVAPTIVDQTPTNVRVYVQGVDPFEVVEFYLSGYSSQSDFAIADANGVISGASIALPAVPAGGRTLLAVAASGTASTSLTVVNAPPAYPTTQVADAAPGLIPGTGVVKWILLDPASGGETYTFPFNPSTWSSPHAPRNVILEATSNGSPILWEGALRAHSFTFSGYLDSQAQYDAMERFRDLNHRHWLVDHRNRAWVVSLDQIDWKPRRVQGKPWAHEYSVRGQIYKGPVTL